MQLESGSKRMQSKLRKQLLDAFSEADGDFLSGQHLADVLGCSRTAIWKHIEDLRKDGFEVEAVRRKGYRIVQTPDTVTADDIRLGLQTKVLGQHIHYEETVDSTQTVAKKLANDFAEEGTIVVAESQSTGKGRLGRKWESPKNTGVWMSVILRPKIPITKAPQLTLITAVAVVQAIKEATGITANIKWPNDVLVKGKKIAGILTELQAEADQISSIIIGVGINVNQENKDFPEELHPIATSIALESNQQLKRVELIRIFLAQLEKLYFLYLDEGFQPIKRMWESYANSIGKRITARTLTGEITGKALGITDDGVLQLLDDTDEIHHIYSADIHILED